MEIRAERIDDHASVRALNLAAFDDGPEARLVDALRAEASPLVSLVAEDEGEVVGHILFSPASLEGERGGMGLAPMAVAPARQGQGIGTSLVKAGLQACRELGVRWVVVLGHPEYYPRFGFMPASCFAVTSDYAVPDPVFMAQELVEGSLAKGGRARYHEVFDSLEE